MDVLLLLPQLQEVHAGEPPPLLMAVLVRWPQEVTEVLRSDFTEVRQLILLREVREVLQPEVAEVLLPFVKEVAELL